MLLADPMSRLNPLPNEELLDLQKVCLVRSSDEKLNPVYFGLILTRTLKLKCRSVCQESQNTQTKETLEPHEVPTRPWQVVGTDLFTWNGDEYLFMCDYYSKFPIIKKIHNGQSTGQTVVRLTKCVMSEQGVTEVIISDNGPQYDCQSYKQFSKEWASNIQSPAQDTHSPTGFFE